MKRQVSIILLSFFSATQIAIADQSSCKLNSGVLSWGCQCEVQSDGSYKFGTCTQMSTGESYTIVPQDKINDITWVSAASTNYGHANVTVQNITPGGLYGNSCYNIQYDHRNDSLNAKCRNNAGQYINTSLSGVAAGAKGVNNCNGTLQYPGKVCPDGSALSDI